MLAMDPRARVPSRLNARDSGLVRQSLDVISRERLSGTSTGALADRQRCSLMGEAADTYGDPGEARSRGPSGSTWIILGDAPRLSTPLWITCGNGG